MIRRILVALTIGTVLAVLPAPARADFNSNQPWVDEGLNNPITSTWHCTYFASTHSQAQFDICVILTPGGSSQGALLRWNNSNSDDFQNQSPSVYWTTHSGQWDNEVVGAARTLPRDAHYYVMFTQTDTQFGGHSVQAKAVLGIINSQSDQTVHFSPSVS